MSQEGQMLVNSATVAKAREMLLRMHHGSRVGHIGGNLSVLEILLILFLEFKKAEDEVILSKGHAAGALYVALALAGRLDPAELVTFHKEGTRLPGHPPINLFPDIPFATGSLGHGLPLALGMAIAAELSAQDHKHIYCVMSDGEWQEGSNWEAAWFAGHHKLSHLTILIDMNGLQGFGSTEQVASMANLSERIQAQGITPLIVNGHSLQELRNGLAKARQTDRVCALMCNTIKGIGVPGFEGKMESHYDPISDELLESVLRDPKDNCGENGKLQ